MNKKEFKPIVIQLEIQIDNEVEFNEFKETVDYYIENTDDSDIFNLLIEAVESQL